MRHIKDILRDSCDELTYIVAETYGEEAKKETRQAAITARKDIATALEREQSRLDKLKRRSVDEKYDAIIEEGLVSEKEVQLCTSICGYNPETVDAIVYARSGYNSFEQYFSRDV